VAAGIETASSSLKKALIKAARGVDMLLHEVFIHRELPVIDGMRSAKTVAAMQAHHTKWDQVVRDASDTGAERLALSHFVPLKCDEKSLFHEVSQEFEGPIIIGEDLMNFYISS
jgi:ribonuclease Z